MEKLGRARPQAECVNIFLDSKYSGQLGILYVMADITIDDVKKLADLSKISLNEEELHKYKQEIEKILGFVEQLNSIDTGGVVETSQVTGLQNATRPDEIRSYGVDQAGLLKNAPSSEKGYIKVKRVL